VSNQGYTGGLLICIQNIPKRVFHKRSGILAGMENQSRKAYPTDLSDAEYALLEPLDLLPTNPHGRPRKWTLREILNAIFYVRTFAYTG
jgi:hypothetical protein